MNSRFALYLIPPYSITRDISEIHTLLRKQFGFVAADNFQVHCTIKGFTRLVDDSQSKLETLVEKLDSTISDQRPFEVACSELRSSSRSIVLDISNIDGRVNSRLMDFREKIVECFVPHIAPNCDFAASDLGQPFHGHITLAFNDIPPEQQKPVLSFLEDAPIPSGTFTADTFHFLEFTSADWAGPWWKTLAWEIQHTWKLGKST